MKITRRQLREMIAREISNLTEAPRTPPRREVDWNQSKISASDASMSLAAAIQAPKDVARFQPNHPDIDDIQSVVDLGEAAVLALNALEKELQRITDDGDSMKPSVSYSTKR